MRKLLGIKLKTISANALYNIQTDKDIRTYDNFFISITNYTRALKAVFHYQTASISIICSKC